MHSENLRHYTVHSGKQFLMPKNWQDVVMPSQCYANGSKSVSLRSRKPGNSYVLNVKWRCIEYRTFACYKLQMRSIHLHMTDLFKIHIWYIVPKTSL